MLTHYQNLIDNLKLFIKDLNWKSRRPYKNLKSHPDAKFPESTKHQIIRTLDLYIKDTNDGKGGKPDELILPKKKGYGKNLNKIFNLVKASYKKKYLKQVFFAREKYEDKFPDLYS